MVGEFTISVSLLVGEFTVGENTPRQFARPNLTFFAYSILSPILVLFPLTGKLV
jgi:hypothetical protein